MHLPCSAVNAVEKQPSGLITITTSDGGECIVDKEQLCYSSRFFQDMLSTCDTCKIHVDETKENFDMLLDVCKGIAPPATFDTRSSLCWEVYRQLMVISDKYDMPVVRERCEKWLVSRCLRGKVRCADFKFQDVNIGLEWLCLCQKYGLRDLGWYCAYDLGTQLAAGAWPAPVTEFLADMGDPDFLKTILEGVSDSIAASRDDVTSQGTVPD